MAATLRIIPCASKPPERIPQNGRRRRERHVVDDVATLIVCQRAGSAVADPDVDSTTSGIDEQNVFEAEFLGENALENHRRVRHELPALRTDVGAFAAVANLGCEVN